MLEENVRSAPPYDKPTITFQRADKLAGRQPRQWTAHRPPFLAMPCITTSRHSHAHIASLPPGLLFEEEQLAALIIEDGIPDLSEQEMAELARRLQDRLR
jgi:hypothetical protein